MLNYVALIQKENKGYGVIFPDFPGCVSVGKTVDEAYKNSIEALALHIDGIKEDKEQIPEPRTFDEIQKSKEDWYTIDNSLIVYIPYISNNSNKYVRINITLNQTILDKIDRITNNRSAFLSKAAESYLALN